MLKSDFVKGFWVYKKIKPGVWAAGPGFNINFVAKSVASVSHFFVVQPTGKLEIFVNT